MRTSTPTTESYNPNIHSQYLRARYYSVVTASFLTEDSYLGDIREPLTLNRYNYCVSSYLNYVDPSGNTVLWGLLERKIVEMEQRLVAPVIRNKINEAREAIQDAEDAVREAVAGAEEWVINKMAEMTVEFASQGETQANLVLIYLIVGENVYVCTESMKDAFLDRPSRLKIQAERMDLVQSCHIGRYGARLCQMAVGIGETVLGVWAMLSGMPTSSVPRYDPWNIPKGGWGSLAVPITNVFSARLAGAVGACYGAVSTGIALERALEEVVAMADIALGTVQMARAGNGGGQVPKNTDGTGGLGSRRETEIPKNTLKHINNRHNPNNYSQQIKNRPKADVLKELENTTFFNKDWSTAQIEEAVKAGYKEALEKGFTSGQYTFSYAGENVTIALENGVIKTAFGDFRYTYEQLLNLLK